MAVSDRMNALPRSRNVVRVLATAAVLLIVMTVSSAVIASGDDVPKSSLSYNPQKVAFASQSDSGNLPGTVGNFFITEVFCHV